MQELEEKAKAADKDSAATEKDSAEIKEDEGESKKRVRDDNEEELPASKRVKLSDDSASSSSDDVSTHSSDADIDAEENQDEVHEAEENGNGDTNGQEEYKSAMVAVSDEEASGSGDDIEAASVLEEDAPCIHPETEEVVKDDEGNVLPTKNSEDDTAASETVTPVKVTAHQEQTLAQTELKFLEHSLHDTCLLSVLSLLKNVHASYYAKDNSDSERDVKVTKLSNIQGAVTNWCLRNISVKPSRTF